MTLTAPEQTLIADGELLATGALSALSTGIASWFAGAEADVPKISADLVPAVSAAIENLAPKNAQGYLAVIFGIADEAAAAALPPLDAGAIAGLKLAAANVKGALAHLAAEV